MVRDHANRAFDEPDGADASTWPPAEIPSRVSGLTPTGLPSSVTRAPVGSVFTTTCPVPATADWVSGSSSSAAGSAAAVSADPFRSAPPGSEARPTSTPTTASTTTAIASLTGKIRAVGGTVTSSSTTTGGGSDTSSTTCRAGFGRSLRRLFLPAGA